MEYVKLGTAPLTVSRLGFGCDPIGGHDWGAVDSEQAVRAVSLAIDRGVTLFDTADCYGLGESERLLGRALRDRRDEVVVASKFGVRIGADRRTVYDNSPAWLDAALDASLRRLGTDRIDLYQVHYWDGTTPLDAIFERLEHKRREGKIGWYGISNIDLADHGLGACPPGLVSFSFEYSLAERRHEDTICRMSTRHGLTVLTWGSLGQGMLTGKYDRRRKPGDGDRRSRPSYRNFHGARFTRNLEIVDALRAGGEGHSPAQRAMRWILDRFESAVVLAGIKSPAQLEDNIGAMDWHLEAPALAALDRVSRTPEPVER